MLAEGTSTQAATIQEISSTVVDLSDRVNDNAQNTAKAKKLSDQTNDRVHDQNAKMSNMLIAMNDIKEKSNEIQKIIKSIDDITKLPFTTKDDLRDNYPFGLFAVPQSQIVRVHASSGTTGKATVVGYTRKDLDVWSECVARCFSMAGIGKEDVIQIAYGYGLFTVSDKEIKVLVKDIQNKMLDEFVIGK